MGRNRAFDEKLVLDSAASTFVRAGYEATSIDDLVTALGIHRGSLYNAFGSKRGLFLATLDRYVDSMLTPLLDADGTPTNGDLAGELVNGPTLDLLLVAAIERGQEDAEVAAAVRTALAKIEQAVAGSGAGDTPVRAIDLMGARLFARLAA